MSNSINFNAAEIALQIDDIKSRLINIYREAEHIGEITRLEEQYSKIKSEEMIRIVIVGQYSSGKSSVISALTKRDDIKIDSDIATDCASDYAWNGILLTDTPGLYTENPVHDERAIDMIRQSDLLIYCITSDLFNQYTLEDFQRLAFEMKYSGKMFLVINKMSKECGEYDLLVQNYTSTINASLTPHTIAEIPHCFVDAKDYRDGIYDGDVELIEFSHFENFIIQLNDFVKRKGQLGKLDTPIKILKASVDDSLASLVDTEQDRAYHAVLSRIQKKVEQYRSQVSFDIHNCIRRGVQPISEKGIQLSRSVGIEDIDFTENDVNELISTACENINNELEIIIRENIEKLNEEIEEIVDSNIAQYFFKSVEDTVTHKGFFFENKERKNNREKFDTLNGIVEQICGKTIDLAGNGTSVATGLFKASNVNGSELHQIVLKIGHKIGHKFKPWEAVNITKNIGNIVKFVGPVMSIISLFIDIKQEVDEDKRAKSIQKAQLEYRQQFIDISNDIERQYELETNELFDVYNNVIVQIDNALDQMQKTITTNKKLTSNLLSVKNELSVLQNNIF